MKKNSLDKQTFMSGVRQKWFAILLAYSFIILGANIVYDVDPIPFMNFALVGGSVFIVGSSIDSALKIKAEDNKQNNNPPAEDPIDPDS